MSSSNELVPTQQERSLNRQVVLEEDEYTAAMSHIIARDFFPSLVHLDATNDYLDALRSGDTNLISATVRRLEDINTPYVTGSRRAAPDTPYGAGPSDTPLRTPRSEGPPNKRPRLDKDLRLDEFQARYTSEDNSSFTQILDDENEKRKEMWGWAWEAQKRVEEQRGRMLEARERMLIEGPPATGVREKLAIELPVPPKLVTDGREAKKDGGGEEDGENEDGGKEVAVVPLKSEEEVLAPKKDTRSAGVDGWKFKARNSFMFAPDADVAPYDSTRTASLKPTAPKVIKYANTRLPEQDEAPASRSMSVPPSPTRSRIEAAITGTPYHPTRTESNDTLVPNVPSPTPSQLGPTAIKQLMTWGTLNATPRIISQSEDPDPTATPFRITEVSSREVISRKLAMSASKNLRAKANLLGLNSVGRTSGIHASPIGKRGSMAPPSWTPRKADAPGNLTPAARRLLERTTMGTAGARRAEAMERSAAWDGNGKGKEKDLNQVRWTPTPTNSALRNR
ncbi:hypothetical protein BDN72DRAFT_830162 [Pluteus cervinus]|uniref:Uncharacterized protein n=1 Tax=Pluteus cervinus TaxID=181527 RepID=A0ACD3BFU4_9AGAR|nr:hypothetical protein BDN72DRAFT_830162 [Pluteus cervinus]